MKKITWAAIACGGICVCALGYYIFRAPAGHSGPREAAIDPQAFYRVTRIVDGDTFKAMIGRQEITVRLLGINTPETVDPRKPPECYGHEASAEAAALLSGRSVRLEYSPDRERHDRYGRYLLYAYRDDGLPVNEELIKEGFAREYTVGTAYSLQKLFRSDESEARAAKRGLWGACY